MIGPSRAERAIAQLLKAARSNVAVLEAHLGALEEAQRSAARTLEWLAEAKRAQDAAQAAGLSPNRDFAGYLEGAADKRAVLTSTQATLSAEIVGVRDTLAKGRAEIDNLRRLLEGGRRSARPDLTTGDRRSISAKRAS
ncbi:MAG TPA: hypothetical protein VNH64_06905 [Parvularculaceae bacterium]|nr:hypothetical protein [Parvularculaceae bacterium]